MSDLLRWKLSSPSCIPLWLQNGRNWESYWEWMKTYWTKFMSTMKGMKNASEFYWRCGFKSLQIQPGKMWLMLLQKLVRTTVSQTNHNVQVPISLTPNLASNKGCRLYSCGFRLCFDLYPPPNSLFWENKLLYNFSYVVHYFHGYQNWSSTIIV